MTKTQRFDVQDRPPVNRWGEGRVTLLGDAAHPMTPNMSQGACQAIEDAVVLGRYLKESADIPQALRAYEERRMPRTAHIARIAWRLGWAVSFENPVVVALRTLAMRATFNTVILRAEERDVGYDF